MGGMRVGGAHASGLNLGAVASASVGFTAHVLATPYPGDGGTESSLFSIYNGDPDGPFDAAGVLSWAWIYHNTPGRDTIHVSGYGKTSEGWHTMKTFDDANLTRVDPTLFSFTWVKGEFDYVILSIDGERYAFDGYSFGSEIFFDDIQGNLFAGVHRPGATDSPAHFYSTIHAVYFDTVPINISVVRYTDFSSCIPSPATTTSATPTTTTATATTTTTTMAAVEDGVSSTIAITGGGVGSGASAVRLGDGQGLDNTGSSVSPLTIVLILLVATVTLCALAGGIFGVARSRRRRRERVTGDMLTNAMPTSPTKKGEAVDDLLPRSRSRSRSRRSSQSRSTVTAEYATMPTLDAESSDYRPLAVSPRRRGRSSDYRPMSFSSVGGDANYGPLESLPAQGDRTHGYGLPDEDTASRTQGYAQTDTTYADISARRVETGDTSTYASGELG
jgi:hypothetical protein